jgi:hypothetical protein
VAQASFPASERRTPPLALMNSGSPSSVSSALIWWLTADCVRFKRSAARVKFRVSAMVRKVRSWAISIRAFLRRRQSSA